MAKKKEGRDRRSQSFLTVPLRRPAPDEIRWLPQWILGLDYVRTIPGTDAVKLRRRPLFLGRPTNNLPKYEQAYLAPLSEYDKKMARRGQWSSIIYYDRPVNLARILGSWGDDMLDNNFMFVVRAVPRSVRPYLDHMERVKKWGNAAYRKLIDELMGQALPFHDPRSEYGTLWGRDVVVWGRAEAMPSIAMWREFQAQTPSYIQLASFLSSVIDRTPIRFDQFLSDNQLAAACPKIREDTDYLLVNGQAHAYWHGKLSPRFLSGILSKNVDIYVHVERKGEYGRRILYLTTLLRAAEYPDDKGRTPEINRTHRNLQAMGHWERIRGSDALWRAFRAFVPGSPALHILDPLRQYRSSTGKEPPPEDFLNSFVATVDGAKPFEGDSFWGIDPETGEPIFGDRRKNPHILALGKGGRGKTTYTAVHLELQETPFVVHVQLTPARGEGAMTWAKDLGGDVLTLHLPDADNPEDERKLFLEDEKEARKWVQNLAKRWWQTGQPSGLPLVIRPAPPAGPRYAHYILKLLDEFATRYNHWAIRPDETVGERHLADWEKGQAGYDREGGAPILGMAIDDLYGWPDPTPSQSLREIPVEIGNEARNLMVTALEGFHKMGIWVTVTAHEEDQVKAFKPGFLGSFMKEFWFRLDPERHVIVRNPAKRDEVLYKMHTELPPSIISFAGRTE